MKAVDFDYVRPPGLDEACRLLAGAAGEAKIIAGGQTLVPLLAMRLTRPALVVDINGIAALQGIEDGADHVLVRAGTRQAAAQRHAAVRARLPLLAKALGFVGHVQTRNRGTIGGSLANADPSAEIGLAALALDCTLTARSARGERAIPVAGFFRGAMETALAPDECLTAVGFPVWREPGGLGTGFQEVSIRRSDFALVAAAAQLVLDGDGICRRATLALGGADATPVPVDAAARRLVGSPLEDADIAAAVALIQDAISPQSDLHASAEYRRRVAGALAARAVAEAKAEARAGITARKA